MRKEIYPEIAPKETTDVMENCLFTDLVAKQAVNSTMSSLFVPLEFISLEWNLDLKRNINHFNTAKRILVNCVKNN